ncbi:hypothetical protein HT105_25180, partial [Bacteroides fragilis]|nr:hypothetical protein [Bacteroides fragilis]
GLDDADMKSWDGMCAPIKFEGANAFATVATVPYAETLEDHEIEVDYGLDDADMKSWDGMCAPIKFEGANAFATVATVPY